MGVKLTWYADMKAESDLRRMSVPFSVETVPFSKIDMKESQINGARLNDPIRHHKVEDYMQGFRNGDTFPRVVVWKSPTGLVVLSGNQRCEAIRRLINEGDLPKTTELEVYVVGTKDKLLLEIIARSANAAHGEGDTKEERVQQAVYCVNRLGLSANDAAKAFLVSANTIRDHIKAEDVRSKLQQAGIDAHRLGTKALTPISKLDFDESAQVKLGHLAAQHNPSSERIKQVVATVAKQTTGSGRVQAIREFERELSAEAHSLNGKHREPESKVPLRPRRDKSLSLMARLSNFLESENGGEPFRTVEDLQITTQADKERFSELSKKIRYRLGAIK